MSRMVYRIYQIIYRPNLYADWIIMKERIQALNNKLVECSHAYYVLNEPIVPDSEYDKLEKELKDLITLAPEHKSLATALNKVGSDLTPVSKRIRHSQKMLSLENKYTPEEVMEWVEGIRKITPNATFSIEPKVDGNSLAAIYKGRKLVQCLTRGDGESGEDVTLAMKASGALPLTLPEGFPDHLEVRGEVWMSNNQLEKLNQEQERLGKKTWASPRNLASGSMKLKDTEEVARRGLRFLPWDVFGLSNEQLTPHFLSADFKSHHLKHLERGAYFAQSQAYTYYLLQNLSLDGVTNVLKESGNIREVVWHKNMSMPTDGIVIKVEDPAHRKMLGNDEKYPKWACAYKWQSLQSETTLLDVEWSISRQGKLSPVGLLEPVNLGGAIVTRVSLNNPTWMKEKGIIHLPCQVMVVRSGDVIPQIVSVVEG